MTWKLLGRRTALLYLLTIAVSAVACGLLLDSGRYSVLQFPLPHLDSHVHEHAAATGWLSTFWSVGLLLIIAFSILRLPRKSSSLALDEDSTDEQTSLRVAARRPAAKSGATEFTVTGMTCNHCVETVSRKLRQSPGVRRVEVNGKGGPGAVVVGENLDPLQLTAAVNSLGYEYELKPS